MANKHVKTAIDEATGKLTMLYEVRKFTAHALPCSRLLRILYSQHMWLGLLVGLHGRLALRVVWLCGAGHVEGGPARRKSGRSNVVQCACQDSKVTL